MTEWIGGCFIVIHDLILPVFFLWHLIGLLDNAIVNKMDKAQKKTQVLV
jgi:hypothetical protein